MKAVSFFAGCGGLDLGFEQAGFKIIWANEFDPFCLKTYLRNHPNTPFTLEDILNIELTDIPDCDGIIGGPPCQSWSRGGNRKGLKDKRGQLIIKYIEIISLKKPRFFVIENVKGILDNKFKKDFDNFISSLEQAGYDVFWKLLNTADFSIPQIRERVFIIGFRKDLQLKYTFPQSQNNPIIDLRKAIGDLPEKPFFYSEKESIAQNFSRPYNHDVFISPFGSFYNRGNRIRKWNQPSFTINATAAFAPLHPSSPSMIKLGYENWQFQRDKYSQYRRLSVRECARIQTFPDSFVFEYENIKNGYRMVGNAVPPRLAKLIAQSISATLNLSHLKECSKENHENLENILLTGYFKNRAHLKRILKNKIYYVRYDNREGAFKKNQIYVRPTFLHLHHNDEHYLFKLEKYLPPVVGKEYLESKGFHVSGSKYLIYFLFDLIDLASKNPWINTVVKKNNYAPIFSKIKDLIS